jgi:hypothetical protein
MFLTFKNSFDATLKLSATESDLTFEEEVGPDNPKVI